MKVLSFSGGISVPHHKRATEGLPIVKAAPPSRVVIPLSMHTGAPCEPLVQKGQKVKLGQRIGDSDAFVSSPVHSSVSGTVASIEPWLHPALGREVLSVIIESDGQDELDNGIQPGQDPFSLPAEEIRQRIRSCGLVGLGGAAFPTSVKLSPPKGKSVDTYLLNGAECEPYLTGDHRLMLESGKDIVWGLRVMMRACGVDKGFICIEDNKADAVEAMREASAPHPEIKVVVLRTKYPQGSEKHLIKAVLGREVPSGGLPFDVGAMVSNVGTALAVADAFQKGMPLIERVLTLTGSAVAQPANLRVRIGTLFRDIVEGQGGLSSDPGKVVMGGPMMGIAQFTLDVPVIKGTSGIVAMLPTDVSPGKKTSCIKCGRCLEACPMNLVPLTLGTSAEKGMFGLAEEYNALDCIECGCCSYVCPARRPLVHAIRLAKAEILARRRKAASG